MAGKVIIQSGKVLTDGGVVNTCDCCPDCEYCDGTTPLTYEVVISDLVLCCEDPDTGWSSKLVDASNELAGPITLTYAGGCTWQGSVTIAFVVYNNMTCDGDVVGSSSQDITVELIKQSDTAWQLQIYGYRYHGYQLFHCVITDQDEGCTGELEFENDIVNCTPSDEIWAYGGTATVSVP